MGRTLVKLRPEWLSTGGRRYQMGVEFDCPNHGSEDRLRFWFKNPCDGDGPVAAALVDAEVYPRLVYRMGFDLDTLTLTPLGGPDARPLNVYHHWQGYVVDGRVWNALATPMGW